MSDETPQKLEIDWLKTVGGALAAVSSAVLLSTLGAAGTIIGAALGSVVVTVGGALYSQGLARSRQRLAQAQALAMRKVAVAQAEVRRAGRNQRDGRSSAEQLASAQSNLDGVRDDLGALADEPTHAGWGTRFAELPWKRTALAAVALFAAAVVALTGFELAAGRSVSDLTGGSQGDHGPTLGHLVGGTTDTSPARGGTPSEQPTPTDPPSSGATDPAAPSESPSTTPDAPSSPTPSGSAPGSTPGSASPSPDPTAPAPTPSDPALVPSAPTATAD